MIWILIIAFGVWFYYNKQDKNIEKPRNKALDILNKRYASGEIEEEEYISKKDLILK
ncbi:MAG: SHOCT domain-containing protein [Clostridiaceae bacterium]